MEKSRNIGYEGNGNKCGEGFIVEEDVPDWFGFNTPTMQNYILQIEKGGSFLQHDQHEPEFVGEYKNLIIINKGTLYRLQIDGKPQLVLNNFRSRRYASSMLQPHKFTYYAQSIIFIDPYFYYVVVDEDEPDVIFFHSSLNTLIKILNRAAKPHQQPQNIHFMVTSSQVIITVQTLQSKILQALQFNSNIDCILYGTIIKQFPDEILNPVWLPELTSFYLSYQARKRGMKSLNLMHLIIGKYDPKFLFLRKMGSRITVNGDRLEIPNEKKDPVIKSFNALFSKEDLPKERFSLNIVRRESNLNRECSVKRRFLSMCSNSDQSFIKFTTKQQHPFLKELYEVEQGSKKFSSEDLAQLEHFLLTNLLQHHKFKKITEAFKNLIEHELDKVYKIEDSVVQGMYFCEMKGNERGADQMREIEKKMGELNMVWEKRGGEFAGEVDVVNGKLFFTLPK